MPTIDMVQLERILEKIRRKSRVVAEKALPGRDVLHRESVSGEVWSGRYEASSQPVP